MNDPVNHLAIQIIIAAVIPCCLKTPFNFIVFVVGLALMRYFNP